MKKLSVLITIMLCVTIGGVYATQTYAGTNDIADAYAEAKVTITDAELTGANGTYKIESNLVLTVDQANKNHEAKLVFAANDGKPITLKYIFTTGEYLGERGEINFWGNNKTPGNPTVPIGGNIYPIYRTKILKTGGVWAATETVAGYAKSAWYEESRSNANATQIPSFDPDTFQEGKPE